MHTREEQKAAFERLLDIMDRLRLECPWDKKQTPQSIRHLTIEEVYELSEALLNEDDDNIEEELGDVLLHIVFYAKMQSEKNLADIKTICDRLSDKLIHRHPHIYGHVKVKDEQEVKKNWEQLKLQEKGKQKKSILAGVPSALPPFTKAYRLQDKARGAGFDWKEKAQVWDKVHEEIAEVQAEIQNQDAARTAEEFGDLLFAVINAARLYGVDPEQALHGTNERFKKRFQQMETQLEKEQIPMNTLDINQLERYWQQAKSNYYSD